MVIDSMKNYLFIGIVFLCSFGKLFSQKQILVTGTVRQSENQERIMGAFIYTPNKKKSTITDLNGTYEIQVRLKDTLVFQCLGYKTKRIAVKQEIHNVVLQVSSFNLEEIQINSANVNDTDIRKATGSISKVKMDKIADRPAINFASLLQGKVPGLVITNNGELGKAPKIRIRGTSTLSIKKETKINEQETITNLDNAANQPLYVLDGKIISPDAFAAINTYDIKEIKVLKDATANALYGIKAANGVIEITTKRGIKQGIQYQYNFQQGITLRGNAGVQMMDTQEKLAFEKALQAENAPGYYYSAEYYKRNFPDAPNLQEKIEKGRQKLDSLSKINTDWFQILTRISTYQSHNFSVRGGGNKMTYYLSSNFSKQGGKFNGNQLNRYTFTGNFDIDFSDKIKLLCNANLGTSQSDTPHGSENAPATLLYNLNPYEQPEKGVLYSYRSRFDKKRYKDMINQYSSTNLNRRFGFSTTLFTKFYEDVQISSIVGVDYVNSTQETIIPPTSLQEQNKGAALSRRGQAKKNKTGTFNFTTNTRLNYQKNYKNHQFHFTANMDYYRTATDLVGVQGYGLPNKQNSAAGINNSVGRQRNSKTSSSEKYTAQMGFGGSFLYNYAKKIDMYVSYKTDASSLMPVSKRWNTFWAVGATYDFSVFENKAIKDLKLTISYGVTASLAGINPSLAIPTFSYNDQYYLELRDFSLKDLFNEKLKPEKGATFNATIAVKIFNTLNLNIQTYHKRTTDLLITVPIPPSNGFSNQLKNVGVLDNQGIEFSLSGYLLDSDQFRWYSALNFAYNQNKVINLYDGDKLYLSNDLFPTYEEGKPVDLIYGLVKDRISTFDGFPIYLRKDGTEFNGQKEKAKREDYIVLGVSTPPFNAGWNHSFAFGNWSFSADFYGTFGGIARYKNTTAVRDVTDANKNAIKGQLQQTWFSPGDEGKKYQTLRYSSGGNLWHNSQTPNTKNVGHTDYIRLMHLDMAYRFPVSVLDKFKKKTKMINMEISGLRMYLQARNIFTWTLFKGADPESGDLAGSVQPMITLGMNVRF